MKCFMVMKLIRDVLFQLHPISAYMPHIVSAAGDTPRGV